jgi:hypothetical protein
VSLTIAELIEKVWRTPVVNWPTTLVFPTSLHPKLAGEPAFLSVAVAVATGPNRKSSTNSLSATKSSQS